MFLTAALTGLWQSELLGLEWRDVDFAAERIRVRRTNVRGHRVPPKSRYGSRSVPMPQVAAALREHLDRSRHRDRQDLVFGHPLAGKVLSYSAIDQRFKRALRAAKVREVRFEELRHTFGTRLAAEGVPIRDIRSGWGTRTSGRHRSMPPTNRESTRQKWPANRFPKWSWSLKRSGTETGNTQTDALGRLGRSYKTRSRVPGKLKCLRSPARLS